MMPGAVQQSRIRIHSYVVKVTLCTAWKLTRQYKRQSQQLLPRLAAGGNCLSEPTAGPQDRFDKLFGVPHAPTVAPSFSVVKSSLRFR